jgi:hypothetical protein
VNCDQISLGGQLTEGFEDRVAGDPEMRGEPTARLETPAGVQAAAEDVLAEGLEELPVEGNGGRGIEPSGGDGGGSGGGGSVAIGSRHGEVALSRTLPVALSKGPVAP